MHGWGMGDGGAEVAAAACGRTAAIDLGGAVDDEGRQDGGPPDRSGGLDGGKQLVELVTQPADAAERKQEALLIGVSAAAAARRRAHTSWW